MGTWSSANDGALPRRSSVTLFTALWLTTMAAGARGEDTWLRLETPHFELAGNSTEGELRRVALKFESFRHALEQILGSPPSEGPPPRVLVFKDRGSYKPYLPIVDGRPVEVGGYFLSGRARPFITLTLTPWADDPYKVVFHEYVHFVTSKRHGPGWFSEGYAEFLAGCEIDGDKVSLGRPDPGHIRTLRVRTPYPLLTLMSMPVPAHDREAQHLFYAQSWLLVHYLMTERPDGRAQMIRFLNLTASGGEISEETFQKAFGSSSVEIAKALQRYAEGQTMAYYRVPIAKAELPRDLKPRRISFVEAEALLAELVAQHSSREAEGRGRLEEVLKQEPGQAVARQALADLDAPPQFVLRAHDVMTDASAAALMSEITSLTGRVSALLTSAEPPTASASAEVEGDLRAFLERHPDSAEAFISLAQLRGRMGAPPDETLGLLKQAVAARPADISPRLALARAYGGRDDFAEARRVLEEGAALANNSALREIYAGEIAGLPLRRRASGYLVELKCDPSGRLDFVFETQEGRRLTLRAATPSAFRVFRGGKSVKESLDCGPQRRPMAAVYANLDTPEAGIDGALTSLQLEQP